MDQQIRCATSRYFQICGSIHDIESNLTGDNSSSLNVQIFFSHWGHLAILFILVSRNIYHIAWNGNYELWILNPIATQPLAHGIWDPDLTSSHNTIVLSSGIYNWLYTTGFHTSFHLYNLIVICELLAVISIPLALIHLIYNEELLHWLRFFKPSSNIQFTVGLDIKAIPLHQILATYFDLYRLRLNCHTGILFGFLSIAWAGHQIYRAIPISRGCFSIFRLDSILALFRSSPFYTKEWMTLNIDNDKNNHLFRSSIGAGKSVFTFLGGLKSNTISQYLTDIAHHHLAFGILFVWASHLYNSFMKGFGHRINDVITSHSSFIAPLAKSIQLQLSIALAGIAVIPSWLAQVLYSLTPYLYLSYDYIRTVALYLHHSWIASFLMMASFTHAGIFLIRDWQDQQDVIQRMLAHKGAPISHLSWICLWLGFHTLALYIHNDTVTAFSIF